MLLIALCRRSRNNQHLSITSTLNDTDQDTALTYLRKYYLEKNPFYTGSQFETLEAHNNTENRITASDIIAVATLNTPIKRKGTMGILITEAEEINDTLAKIPNMPIGTLTSDEFNRYLGRESSAMKLWRTLRRTGRPSDEKWQMGPTRVSKLMARKRPHLIPINDSVINRVIDKRPSENDWKLWWEALRNNDSLEERASVLRAAIGRPELATLRVFDVVLWMSGTVGIHKA